MSENKREFGRSAQILSFLILSSFILLFAAQARRFYLLHSERSFVTASDIGNQAPKRDISTRARANAKANNTPRIPITIDDLSDVTITLPHSSKTLVRAITTAPAATTVSRRFPTATETSAAAITTTTALTTAKTSGSTTASQTTTTRRSTTTSQTTTTLRSTTTSQTTTTLRSTTTSKTSATVRSTTTAKTTTTSSTTTTSKTATTTKNNTNIPPNRYNESSYYIVVYKGSQSTVVYGKDNDGNYTRTVKTFTCSTGADSSPTRIGTYKIRAKYRWRYLVGGVYGQYSSSISSSYLFHSVPYYRQDASSLENEEYDKLGSPASKGCIRMCVRDCKWIYDNCPIGTEVNIVNQSGPSGPGVPRRRTDSAYSGWDPSDSWAQGNPYFS